MHLRVPGLLVIFALAAPAAADDAATYEGKSVPEWVAVLKDGDAKARARAGRALGILGPKAKAAVPALLEALKDRDAAVRDWAVYGLRGISTDPDKVVPALVEALDDAEYIVRRGAAEALGDFGREARPASRTLVSIWKDRSRGDALRKVVGEALQKIDPDAAARAGVR